MFTQLKAIIQNDKRQHEEGIAINNINASMVNGNGNINEIRPCRSTEPPILEEPMQTTNQMIKSGSLSLLIIKDIFMCLIFPFKILCMITIPNCRTERWRKYFILTFLVCLLWNSLLCYLLVWMITVIGKELIAK